MIHTPIANQYQHQLEQQTTLKSLSQTAYLRVTHHFLQWLEIKNLNRLNDVDLEVLYPFIHYNSQQKPYAVGSVRIRAAALHLFFNWAYENGHCRTNPMLAYKKAHVRSKSFITKEKEKNSAEPAVLSSTEQQQILNLKTDGSFLEVRNQCIIHLLLASALFAEEIIRLTVEDLDLARGVLTIKGKRERLIHLDKAICRRACQKWLSVRSLTLAAKNQSLLFVTQQNKPLSQRMLHQLVSDYLQKTGITKDRHGPAILRQTAIMNRLKSGEPLEEVQIQTGIKTLARLQEYITLIKN